MHKVRSPAGAVCSWRTNRAHLSLSRHSTDNAVRRRFTLPLTAGHWIYLSGIAVLIAMVVLRKNVVGPAIAATFLTVLAMTGSVTTGISSVFRAAIAATTELLTIFLIIAVMTSLVRALRATGADDQMVTPFQRLMRNGPTAYVVLAAVTLVLSLVFWPTPILPLLAAILIPAALRVGLSPIGAAIAVAIAGQGIALSSDYVLGVAPSLSAGGAGVPADAVADRALVIALIVGVFALVAAYALTVRRTITREDVAVAQAVPVGVGPDGAVAGTPTGGAGIAEREAVAGELDTGDPGPHLEIGPRRARLIALSVPVCFGALLVFILLGRFTSLVPRLEDGAAAPLVGGTAALLLVAVTALSGGTDRLERVSGHFVHGVSFAFRIMGMVIPVAGFIYVGLGSFSGKILGLPEGAAAPDLLLDVVSRVQGLIPDNRFVALFVMLLVGMVLGLDGNGWPALPFTGALSAAIGGQSGIDPATLAAVAQNGSTWVGGGTLVIWSTLIAVAGITGVSVTDLARKLFLPVVGGLVLATTAAGIIW
ncbi:TRAP transporter large permease subunit [Pseudonocardia yunnanensis]|uniref:TRAP transporter large permease subunit n=1 Tax=Pseudonocardia yunnanensis TaxID=58107 RepID=A0ABW4FAJ0_9PSEU